MLLVYLKDTSVGIWLQIIIIMRQLPLFAVILLSLLCTSIVHAQEQNCTPCKRPGELASFADSVFDVQFNNATILRGVRSANRTTLLRFGRFEQAVTMHWRVNNVCHDTTVLVESIKAFSHEGIGGSHDPLRYPVYPARDIYQDNILDVPQNFVEIYGLIAYAGKDTTARKIGFTPIYESLEAIVSPFGSLLGERLKLGIGGGILFEGGRTRFPLFGHLRYSFLGSDRIETVNYFYPDSCSFQTPGQTPIDAPINDYSERSISRPDSTVILVQQVKRVTSDFRPFLYIEGGTLFDGTFDGSGTPSNSVNPNDRKPLLLGAGIGLPIGDLFMLALGYRYMQLHLATPCPQCEDRSIINRNTIHSITLKVGVRLPW